ncbi:MAG: GNAT family N-acetyltransferase [Bacteroidales bacterium]|nr:GNAT family N-acetyltransferase [Bacteroidales bacterium]NLK79775.1 GNAT family N-acetyltransferase [Bacteroidales bacterium]HKM30739.1 GNAT family N-acetyltransferase [Bacteroidales bacterium]HQB23675.1 GNAT family N-acetyltransferase [Bacteroidales bacterium]
MIRTASVNDKAALLDIWSAAFGDSADYAEFAVSNCLSLGTVLYHPEGKSCLTLFPLSLHRKGKSPLNGAYMYGVATHPEQQKKGYSSLLLYHTSKLAKFLVLYPASDTLRSFYAKRGFDVPVSIPAPIEAGPTPVTDLSKPVANPLDSSELYAVYQENALKQKSVFLWSSSLFDYAYRECLFRGGHAQHSHLCYPSLSGSLCKPFVKTETNGSFLQGLARFHVRTPGLKQTPPLFYLPLD